MKNIAIYYRVSTDKQDLDSQRVVVEKWLSELDQPPKKVWRFQDEGISGTTIKRPAFKEMMRLAVQRKIDTIVVYRLDRFSRHATTAIRLLLEIDEYDVAFISVTQPVLNLGPENPFRRTLLAAFAEIAEIERETIVARVKSGLDAARRRGTRLGAPQKVQEVHREKALALRKQGRSLRRIAAELNLSIGTVHKVLKESSSSSNSATS